ncbi:membrane protein, partial [Streptomyces sp. NRRL S-444]
MGGKYRVTGAAYPRMSRPRRRRRIVLTLLGAVVGLALLGYGTLQLMNVFRGGSSKPVAAGKDCATPKPRAGAAAAATPAAKPAVALPQPG